MGKGKKLVEDDLKKRKKKWKDLVDLCKKEHSTENTTFLDQAETVSKKKDAKTCAVFHTKVVSDVNLNAKNTKALNEAKKQLDFWIDAKKRKVDGFKTPLAKAVADYIDAIPGAETEVAKMLISDTCKRLR